MAFSNPMTIVGRLGIKESQTVADFGCGAGYHTLPLSNYVGNTGKVYAIDIQEDILTTLKNDIKDLNLKNIETIVGDLEKEGGSHLPDKSIDVVVCVNVLFQIENKDTFIREINRVLKDGGKAVIVSWSESFGNFGPTKENVVIEDVAKKIFIERGFSFERNIEAGDHHYGLIFAKDE